MSTLSPKNPTPQHVHIGGYTHVHATDILFVAGDSNYSHVHFVNNQKVVMVASTLRVLEARLADRGFIRVNRSALVNPDYIRDFDKFEVELTNGKLLPIARRRRREVGSQLAAFQNTLVTA